MREARMACTVAGTSIAVEGPYQSIGAALPARAPRLDERPHALLEEERVAAGPRDEERLQRLDAGVGPSKRQEQLAGALGRQGVQAELGVVALAAPAMLVLRPVVDQQEHPGGGQALDQAVEERLRLGVDPVEVLEDHEQRLPLALSQQEALDGVEGALAALGGSSACHVRIVDGHIEQRQQGGERSARGPDPARGPCRSPSPGSRGGSRGRATLK